jgi:hypothetical protein
MKWYLRELVLPAEVPACRRLTRFGRTKGATYRRCGRSASRAGFQAAGLAGLAILSAGLLYAQVPWGYGPPPGGPTPNTPMAQQNAQRTVQSQVNWFQNRTQSASNYGGGGYGMVWQQFQTLQGAYNAFKATLSPQQLSSGANKLAELDAGLGILEEAFTNYTQDVADGQSSASAFNNMCQVLYRASGVWLQEFNSVCNRLQVGWQ